MKIDKENTLYFDKNKTNNALATAKEKGIAEGMEKGIAEGKLENQRQIALNMKR